MADSKTVTAWPEREADMAVARPLRPAPTTTMLSLTPAVGWGLSVCVIARDWRETGVQMYSSLGASKFLQGMRIVGVQNVFLWRADLGSVGIGGPGYIYHMVSRRGVAGGGPDPAVRAGPHYPASPPYYPHTAGTGLPGMLANCRRLGIFQRRFWLVCYISDYRYLDLCQGYPTV